MFSCNYTLSESISFSSDAIPTFLSFDRYLQRNEFGSVIPFEEMNHPRKTFCRKIAQDMSVVSDRGGHPCYLH